MLRKLIPLLALGLVLAPVVHAQTVDEVLAKHFEAEGGLDKLKSLQSRRVTGTMMMGPGMEAPIILEQKRPGKRRIEFTVQGMTGVQAFDGERAWSLLPFMGKTDPEYASEEDSKNERDESDFDGPLVDWKAKGHKVELVGTASLPGGPAHELKVTLKSGAVRRVFVDSATGFIVRMESTRRVRGHDVALETEFGDYRKTDGVAFPHSIEGSARGRPNRLRIVVDSVEVNPRLDESRFKMPR